MAIQRPNNTLKWPVACILQKPFHRAFLIISTVFGNRGQHRCRKGSDLNETYVLHSRRRPIIVCVHSTVLWQEK